MIDQSMIQQYWHLFSITLYGQFLTFLAVGFFTVVVEDVRLKGGKYRKLYPLVILLAWSIMLQYHGWLVLPYTLVFVYICRKYGVE